MKVLGISPLDLDASASLVEDGRVLFAAGEERFSRRKQHAGFPGKAIEAALNATGTDPSEIDAVAYSFLTWEQEAKIVAKNISEERASWRVLYNERGRDIVPSRTPAKEVPGLKRPDQRIEKGTLRRLFWSV